MVSLFICYLSRDIDECRIGPIGEELSPLPDYYAIAEISGNDDLIDRIDVLPPPGGGILSWFYKELS